jgi:NADPH2:quinone reductase
MAETIYFVTRLFESGGVKPVVYSQVYPLEKLSDGLDAIAKRKTWGKAIVRIKDEKTGHRARL